MYLHIMIRTDLDDLGDGPARLADVHLHDHVRPLLPVLRGDQPVGVCGVWVVRVGLKVKSSDEPAIVDECGWVGEGYVDVVVGLVWLRLT